MSDRKLLCCFLISFLLLIFPMTAFAQRPTSREYPYLYKSPRAMGMGGAYTAVGGSVDTLFYNPAGLSNLPKDKGWEVNLLNLSLEVGKNAADLSELILGQDCGENNFCSDMQDAFDTEDLDGDGDPEDDQLRAVNDVLVQYRGENMHLRVADFTSIGKGFDRFAFGVGELGSVRLDAMTHQGFGPEGFLEVNFDATYGGIGGFSYGLTENLFAGLSVKSLHREALVHNFATRELVEKEDDLEDYIVDELRESGDAVGFDAGLIWKFAQNSRLKPSVGVSIMNIGDLDFGDAGEIPMTVNAGISVNPEIPVFRSLIVGADYVDIFKNYEEDDDMGKRIRLGGELQLFDKLLTEMTVRAGLYQGYPTYGADLRLLIVKLSYVAYTEEVGGFAGQDEDKRQLLTLTLGW